MQINRHADIAIRLATVEDAPLLTEMGARTFYDTFAAQNTPENMSSYLAAAFNLERQTAELQEANSRVLLAFVGDEPVGYARLLAGSTEPCVTEPEPVELIRLYAEKAWQGRGVGRALMQACLAEAQRMGGRTLWLGVWEHNARARAIYDRWGFRPVGTHIFPLGDDPQTDLILVRPL